MIKIRDLGVITDNDINNIRPYEVGFSIENFPFENLCERLQEKVNFKSDLTGFKHVYLSLDIEIQWDKKQIAVKLYAYFLNRKSVEMFPDSFVYDIQLYSYELEEIKKQIINPFIEKLV